MTLVGVIACKMQHNLSSCNSPESQGTFEITVDDFLDGQHTRQPFAVACNSDSEILASTPDDSRICSSYSNTVIIGVSAHIGVSKPLCDRHLRTKTFKKTTAKCAKTPMITVHRLDADKFPTFSVGWTWQGFCQDFDSMVV